MPHVRILLCDFTGVAGALLLFVFGEAMLGVPVASANVRICLLMITAVLTVLPWVKRSRMIIHKRIVRNRFLVGLVSPDRRRY